MLCTGSLIVGVREPETSQFSPFSRVFLPRTVGPATTNHLSTDSPLAQAPPLPQSKIRPSGTRHSLALNL